MVTRERRLAEFDSGDPPADQPLEILCEDHCGTYVIPFECRWLNGEWTGRANDEPIQAVVLGWRRRP